jgi:hypothetical protein
VEQVGEILFGELLTKKMKLMEEMVVLHLNYNETQKFNWYILECQAPYINTVDMIAVMLKKQLTERLLHLPLQRNLKVVSGGKLILEKAKKLFLM